MDAVVEEDDSTSTSSQEMESREEDVPDNANTADSASMPATTAAEAKSDLIARAASVIKLVHTERSKCIRRAKAQMDMRSKAEVFEARA